MATPRARRALLATTLWQALRTSAAGDGAGLVPTVLAAPRMLAASLTGRYPGLGRGRLAVLLVGLAYLVSPVDLVPEGLLLAVGLVDDVAVAAWLSATVLAEAGEYVRWERSAPARGAWIPGDVVDAGAPAR